MRMRMRMRMYVCMYVYMYHMTAPLNFVLLSQGVTVISNEATGTLQPTTSSASVRIPTSLPSTAKGRVRKRTYAKAAYERGRKIYQMKDKITIKKVQSLRTGAGSFLNTNDRPTMATNAFQVIVCVS